MEVSCGARFLGIRRFIELPGQLLHCNHITMKYLPSPRYLIAALASLVTVSLAVQAADPGEEGFVSLFNGKDLTGWKDSGETPDCFSVNDAGELVVSGGRAHLFYVGEDGKASFGDFELKLKGKTFKGANSGVYFHTRFQAEGWPDQGYECQVNSSQKDPKKTGSLYAVVNCFVPQADSGIPTQEVPYVMIDHKAGVNRVMKEAPSRDGEWFDYHITVKKGVITIRVNGEITVQYSEPKDGSLPNQKMPGRKLSSGTFAFQAHDPDSTTHFKDIRVKRLD